MARNGALESYASTGGAKQDILDIITLLNPTETPFLSRLGVSRAYNTLHTWLTDVHNGTAGTGEAIEEGASAVNYRLSDKVREYNYTQISDRVFMITGTEEAISHYGLDSQYAYQLEKAMKELKIIQERVLLGSSALGAGVISADARTMRGAFIFGVSAGGNAATASGAGGVSALTESSYNQLMQDIYNNGGTPDTTFVNGFLKRRISAFASNNARYVDMGNSKRLSGIVSIYESDFGTQEIILDRWCRGHSTSTGGERGAGLVLKMSNYKVAYLRKPFTTPLAVDGDRKSVQILTEYTLENLAPLHQGTMSGFATA